jgi:predicted NAD/FAD-dependent oxidoreductase
VPEVVVVGAGPAGLTVARELAAAGREVVVLEKSRGPGGRCSTRRTDHGAFDHGAPVLHLDDGEHVPQPRVSAFGRGLAEGLDVRTGTRAAAVRAGGVVLDDGTAIEARQVAVCVPAPQAVELLGDGRAREAAAAATYAPCWTAMAAFAAPLEGVPDVVRDLGPIRWAHREGARPGRAAEPERWVVQAAPAWSAERLERPAEAVAPALLVALLEATGARAPDPIGLAGHRWRFATVTRAAGVPCLLEGGVGAAGDWCLGPRVRDALDSGRALAAALLSAPGPGR